MISSVRQGLQSHVESHVLSFQLFPQEPSYPTSSSRFFHRKCEEEVEANSKHGENGEGWSFLESLSNGHQEDKVYVHHSSTKLSNKSLEMCTESLGSESGSDMGENDISLLTLEADDSCPIVSRYSTLLTQKKAIRKDTTYPPPLTSISGSTSIRVESYRENGRLVLKAMVCSTSPSSYFQAERSHGRLKLQLVKHIEKKDEEDVEEEVKLVDDDGEEMGMENFGRPPSCSSNRCKQGRHQSTELLIWEPLWVSI
ncbi:unnamed protein product [Citrullus colocynthis]|uniref:FAF domain-containing protein n=1 Tax=Citrullus colocynthis TaxID=252529 RepID=A0ABP0YSF0_9ROSI